MPAMLQCARMTQKIDTKDGAQHINNLKQYLAAKNLTDYCGIGALPKGEGPDGDGITLYQQDELWVLADTCRGKRLNPCLFTSIDEAIAYLKSQLEK